jgi:hypothetical protein
MFAWAAFSFHPACPHTQADFLLSLFYPLHTFASPETSLFPLHTQKRGVHPPKNVSAPTFPRFSCSQALSQFPFFSTACALFHFAYHPYLPSLQYLPHSSPENPGVPPPVQPIRRTSALSSTLQATGHKSQVTASSPVTLHWSLATGRWAPIRPICRLRRCSPLRDTGTSTSVASEFITRLRHVQPHR